MSAVHELPTARWEGLRVAVAEWGLIAGWCALGWINEKGECHARKYCELREAPTERRRFPDADTLFLHENDLRDFRQKMAPKNATNYRRRIDIEV